MKVITAILILVSTYLAQGHTDQSAIDEVETIDSNTVRITFGAVMDGKAVVILVADS